MRPTESLTACIVMKPSKSFLETILQEALGGKFFKRVIYIPENQPLT